MGSGDSSTSSSSRSTKTNESQRRNDRSRWGASDPCLRQQPGLLAGLLVTDQRTFVYSSTPLLVEAGSKSE
jgi:hypothetical protein